MRSTRGFAAAIATAGVIGLLFFSPAAAAQGGYEAGKGSWTVRGFGAWIDTEGFERRSHSLHDFPVFSSVLTIGDGDGVGLSLEYRITRRIGVEALALEGELDGEFRLVFTDPPNPEQRVTQGVGTELYGLGVNLHLTPGRRVDAYVGPVVAEIRYDDFSGFINCGHPLTRCTFQTTFSDDTALGMTLGADVTLGNTDRWALSAAVRQLWSDPEDELERTELEMDPLIVTAGVAFRFGG